MRALPHARQGPNGERPLARQERVWGWVLGAGLVVGCLALYVATRSPWLDDWDSVNFARAIAHFDVQANQPQPPGYPVYVLLARLLNLATHNSQLSLTLLSALCGAGAIAAFYAIAADFGVPWAALPLALMPLFWLSAGMALSDVPGLCFATTAVWLLERVAVQPSPAAAGEGRVRAPTRYLIAGCAVTGLAGGVRPQDALVPLAVLLLFVAPSRISGALTLPSPTAVGEGALAFVAGCLAWAIPLTISLGGIGPGWRVMMGQGQYVGSTDSLLARPLTWANLGQRLADFGNVFGAYLGGSPAAGWLAMLAVGLALVLFALVAQPARLTHLALAWLLPYAAVMVLVLRPDDPRKILPAIPPLLLLFAAAFRSAAGRTFGRVLSGAACAGLAAFFAFQAWPLVRTLDHQAPPPDQAAAYLASADEPAGTVVVAGASFNAITYRQPRFKAFLIDDLDQRALAQALTTAQHLVVLDKEGFTPPASWIATDTRTFQRDPLVLPKASQVWLEAYEPLPASAAGLQLPADGAIHVGTPDDISYLLSGWNRPEMVANVAARWAGQSAQVRFAVTQPADATLTLVGVAYPSGQRLAVLVNGQQAGTFAMSRDWAPYQLFVPARMFHAGSVNTVTLQHSAATSAFQATDGQSLDQRPLAAAYSLVQVKWR